MMTSLGLALVGFALGFAAWAYSVAMSPQQQSLVVVMTLSLASGACLAAGVSVLWVWAGYEYRAAHGNKNKKQKALPLKKRQSATPIAATTRIDAKAFASLIAIVVNIVAGAGLFLAISVPTRVPHLLSPDQRQYLIDKLKIEASLYGPIKIQIYRDDNPRSIAFANQLSGIFSESGVKQVSPPGPPPSDVVIPRGITMISEPEDNSENRIWLALYDVGIQPKQKTDFSLHSKGYAILSLRNNWF
jgi:hypothetical protein